MPESDLEQLPARARTGIEHAVLLFNFMSNKDKVAFPPVFQPLLGPIDATAEAVVLERLEATVPEDEAERDDYFEPDLSAAKKKHREFLGNQASLLKRLLVHRSPIMPTGLLRFCVEYASKEDDAPSGVLDAVRDRFADLAASDLPTLLAEVYDFRNTYIAHAKAELTDRGQAEEALRRWITLLVRLTAVASEAERLGADVLALQRHGSDHAVRARPYGRTHLA